MNSIKMISPIQKVNFKGFEFYVKRDDLLGELNGNKARKLAFYLHQKYPKNQRFISYGGTQSNALGALSIFAKQRSYKFLFVCEKISHFLKSHPCGNYALALENNVEFIENTSFLPLKEFALSLCEKNDIFIEQGIANFRAEQGYIELAKEIQIQSENLNLQFDIFLPSGTGTSAAFLARNSQFKVFTCACVGDIKYLKQQILTLMQNYDFSNLEFLQSVKKYHFAKPYKEFYQLYIDLKYELGIEFDLLYDILALNIVLKKEWKNPLLYIHQGGLLGNLSMLQRYRFKKLI
ncbi:1-aminocyclopropane-1-carboxylate deaminase/D-cysteine desulfhydrase [Campylobacter hepaticus]|uniref:1-aminocyclopropane-1-carboxylate deaminase/D-cysteine desulfhydrase n=1 Tax=Campylobacter hepaticus TaxID=1813019 RepID=A0A6A7JTI8_9BACT|nr:1-aminocyclopropane-1-carboxylate deaminase/D-cysteine desulfhydrase [Campylobacter hepaticus]AXP08797.1 1-aminocyclopropane-1-carboxylate deaminase/D-cysteine desulfhydrase [Campylobacter hepaticus]MCZ0772648.1 1-aminocyclopropane-1-carboxylate deaminase/D-cysteine desulfhydrase [Campylobacter hepaticus]MCZ0774116.1 1-aminocyclopropane-1-carboxylate deaminase/D-cysteine desulfhydrase [Campylobacter hepaticus]MCZ0775368.1 1-aminocyclopropane-1-carboxylate deaminase/D-cysteine desulfhydrase [